MIPWPPPRALLNIALAGALVRLLGLGIQPLDAWEANIWAAATEPEGVTVGDRPGLLPTWIATALAQMGDLTRATSLRAVSAVAGVLGILFAYALALRLLDPSRQPRRGGFPRTGDPGAGRRLALWFTAFYAFHSTAVDMAQHAGGLSIALTSALGLWCAILAYVDDGRKRAVLGIAIAGLVLVLSHPAGAVVLAGGVLAGLLLVRTHAREDGSTRAVRLPLLATFVLLGVLYALRPDVWSAWLREVVPGSGAGSAWTLAAWASALAWLPALLAGLFLLPGTYAHRTLALGLLGVPVLGLASIHLLGGTTNAWLLHAAVLLLPGLWWLATAAVHRLPAAGRTALLALLALGHVVPLAVALGSEASPAPYGRAGTLGERSLPSGWHADPDHPLHVAHEGRPPGRPAFDLAAAFVASHAQDAAKANPDARQIVLLHGADLEARWRFHAGSTPPSFTLPRDADVATTVRDQLDRPLRDATRIYVIQGPVRRDDDVGVITALASAAMERTALQDGVKFVMLGPLRLERAGALRITIFERTR